LLDIRIPISSSRPACHGRRIATQAVGVLRQSPIFQQGVRVSAVGDITLPLLGSCMRPA
jgi:hypothetical protein